MNVHFVMKVKEGHVDYSGSLFDKDDVTFPRFSIKVSPMRDASKASFEMTVT